MMIYWEVVEERKSMSSRVHSPPLKPAMRYLPQPFLFSHIFCSVPPRYILTLDFQGVSASGKITSTYTNYTPQGTDEEEPEVITQWRERRDLQLQAREERSEEKKQETIKTAQQNIDDFYENYNTKKEKTIAQTRREAEEFLASREDTSAGGTSWERIAKLVDLSGKGARGGANGTGKEKFRELLMSLKKDEKAPGATGY